MNRFSPALAVSISLLALAGVGYVITSERTVLDTSDSGVEFDVLRARVIELESRLGSLASGPASLSPQNSDPASASEATELAEDAGSPVAADAILARVEAMETRLRGLEQDPADRAYTYLESDSVELRRRGVWSLASLAANDPDAEAALNEMINDPDASVRIAAMHALAKSGGKSAVPFAADLLADEDAEVRREAINTLTRMGTKEAASEIATLINDENDEVRRLAVDSMGRLDYKPSAASLLSALDDPNVGVRGEAISSLGEVGATESLGRLRELYTDQTEGAHRDADHRVRIAMAMKQLGDREAVQSEIARLGNHVHYENNGGAMKALMWIGRDEPAAMEVFARAAQASDSEWIRREAKRMLKQAETGEDQRGKGE